MGYRTARVRPVDVDTGEVLDVNLVAVPLSKPGIDGEFFMARQEALLRLAAEQNISNQDLRVLLVYFACTDWENYVQVSHQWIADHLGMERSNVSRSTKKLVDAHILVEGEKIGRHKTYRVNEFYGWKGDSRNYQKKIKKDAKLG